ncbi:MAG: hypothetical protein WBV82_00440 [Myxococcaceae bacterium]
MVPDLQIDLDVTGDGRRRLTVARPPHPMVIAAFWLCLGAGTVLTLGAAAMETSIRCSQADRSCVAQRVDRAVFSLRAADRSAAIQVEPASDDPQAGLALVFVDAEKRSPVAWALWTGDAWLHRAADSVNRFLREPDHADLELRSRSWPMAMRVGAPLLLIAATVFAFSRRRFRLTLEQLPDAVAVRRQSLLSTAHLPISNQTRSTGLDLESGADGVRLVLSLSDGQRFAVTPWVASERELREVRERLRAFLLLQ